MGFQINKFSDEIAQICLKLGVHQLDLFGSATTDEFTNDSDLDFLVDFFPDQAELLQKFLTLKEQLAIALHRDIDLITMQSVRNPYLKESIERTRKNVFVA
jgi:hypothetical protein